ILAVGWAWAIVEIEARALEEEDSTARTAISAQGAAEEPAAEGEHNARCDDQVKRESPIKRLDHDSRWNADNQHYWKDKREHPADLSRPGIVENFTRITHQAGEQPPKLHQTLISHHPNGRRSQQ